MSQLPFSPELLESSLFGLIFMALLLLFSNHWQLALWGLWIQGLVFTVACHSIVFFSLLCALGGVYIFLSWIHRTKPVKYLASSKLSSVTHKQLGAWMFAISIILVASLWHGEIPPMNHDNPTHFWVDPYLVVLMGFFLFFILTTSLHLLANKNLQDFDQQKEPGHAHTSHD